MYTFTLNNVHVKEHLETTSAIKTTFGRRLTSHRDVIIFTLF